MIALPRGALPIRRLRLVSVAQDIKARIDIVDLIGESVQLSKSGSTFKARCPFHNERTPSFVVDPRRQSWRCYGACSDGGDVFAWIEKRDNVDFRAALKLLADRAGIRLQSANPERAARERLQRRLIEANDAALSWWRGLLDDSAGEHAREYIAARGISPESAATFEIGYADGADGDLQRRLGALGFRTEELEQAGLVVITERGPRDRFRDRLMFPIRNSSGECVGFSGRALGDDPAKYVNTPESPVFQKRALLYGLHLARSAIREAGFVVVVEGYTDVVSARAHGSANVVASMGTALTESQVALIAPLASDVRFALDADAAGQAATRRGIDTVRHAFDAEGFIRGQDRLSADIRIIQLPQGRDPDELIREQPDLWNRLVADAIPFLDFLLAQASARHDLSQPRGRADFADELAPVVHQIRDEIIQTDYIHRIAALAQVAPAAIARRRPRQGAEPLPRSGTRPDAQPRGPERRDKIQTTLVALAAFSRPAAQTLDGDAPGLIDDAEDRSILSAILAAEPSADWIAALPEPERARADALKRDAARSFAHLSDEDATAAAAEITARIRELRSREHLRLLSMQVAEFDRSLPHGPVALAAVALDRGDDAPLDPDLLPAADAVVQVRDRAVALHASPNPS